MKLTFTESVGATLGLLAMAVIIWAVVIMHNETALGLAGGVLTAATGFFLRAKVQPPHD